jgi:hypothetical protein
MKTRIFLTGLALVASITMISAKGNGNGNGNGCRTGNGNGNGQCQMNEKKASYVDANKDGVCDNKTTNTQAKKGQHNGNGSGNGQHLQNGTGPKAANGTCVNPTAVVKK